MPQRIPAFLALAALIGILCACREEPGAFGLAAIASKSKVRVGVAAGPGDERRERLVVREFNAVTAEGEFLWKVIHPTREGWNFAPADAFIAFAEQHNLYTTVTHFIWDQFPEFSQPPDWVHAITNPDDLKSVMRQHMETIAQRYGGRIKRWIAVNEPFDYFKSPPTLYKNHFYNVLGPSYIGEAFRIAKEAAPDSELWLNEIFTEADPAKSDALVQLTSELVSQGVPIDGVGIQGHLFSGDPDFALMERTMHRLDALGVKVAITELDAPVAQDLPDRLNVQAKRMANIVSVCLAVPECEAITWWGVDDSISWINWLIGPGLAPLLFDASLRPKPAYFAVREVLENGRP